MVDPEVGDKVPDGHVVEAKLLHHEVQTGGDQTNTDIAQDDELGITVLVQRAAGVEVVDTTAETVPLALAATLALVLVAVVASDVGQEVVGPANELLQDQHEQGEGGGLLGEVSELVGHLAKAGGLLLPGSGDKDHVTLHVAGGLVVLSVRDLPAEVGDEQGRVEDPAGDVVDEAGVGEGAVAALVGNDPEAGGEETLEDGVEGPETSPGGSGGDVLGGHKVVPDGEGGAEEDHVAEDVAVAPDGGALEAVLGDGIVDVLDGEVGHLELVAVRVDQAAIARLGLLNVHLGQRGERGGRSRGPGGVRGRDGSRRLGVRDRGASNGRVLPGHSRRRGHCCRKGGRERTTDKEGRVNWSDGPKDKSRREKRKGRVKKK